MQRYPLAPPPRVRTKHVESGAAGHKQRRKAENSHCTARRAHRHHAGHIESTAGLAEMREQIRQAIKQKQAVSPCKQMPLSSQREGPAWRPVSGRRKGPKSVNPYSWGSHLWGLFSGPENGHHFGAAAETRSRTAAVTRTLEIRRPFATETQYATCLGVSTASHHIRIRPAASPRAHLLCCRLLPLTPSSCQRQSEKDTETHE